MKESEDLIKEQIISVFDNYEDDFAAQGWTELRKKYPENRSRKLPIWWMTAAAAACLIMALGTFLFSNTEDKINATNPTNVASDQTLPHKKDEAKELVKPSSELAQKSQNLVANRAIAKNSVAQNNSTEQANLFNQVMLAKTGSNPEVHNHPAENQHTKAIPPAVNLEQNNVASIIGNENHALSKTDAEEVKKESPHTKLSTEDFLKQESKLLANTPTVKDKTANKNNTTIDVFTGTFFNYHDNQEAQLSAGVGLNANLKLSKNLVFSVGAGISQNKVSYQNDVPVEVASAMMSKRSEQNSPTTALSSTAINDLSFNGRLLSVDIPVALKFYPTKQHNFYISTGINSSSYLSQKYTYDYSASNFTINSGEAQTIQETENTHLSGFDFANSAIIAIGINQNIGKHTLIFEPYYKPALNTMGDKNLRISAAGLNLKFNFGRSKK